MESILQEKAPKIITESNVENLMAANGWLECFKNQDSIALKTISDESDDWKERLSYFLIEFELCDIYIVNESELYFTADLINY